MLLQAPLVRAYLVQTLPVRAHLEVGTAAGSSVPLSGPRSGSPDWLCSDLSLLNIVAIFAHAPW